MLLRILHHENTGELGYVLAEPGGREAAVVDPHARDLPVLLALLDERGLRLRWVLRTHDHDDREPGGLQRLRRLGVPVVQGRRAEGAMRPADGALLPLGCESLRVMATPGHTPHCLCFVWQDRVFCGGLLGVDTCPWQPRPADPGALWDSVTQRLFALPDEMLLFAGHDRHGHAVSTVLEQRRWHPYFAHGSRDDYLARVAALDTAAERLQPA